MKSFLIAHTPYLMFEVMYFKHKKTKGTKQCFNTEKVEHRIREGEYYYTANRVPVGAVYCQECMEEDMRKTQDYYLKKIREITEFMESKYEQKKSKKKERQAGDS